MWDNGDVRQGRRWIQVAEDRGSVDAGQQGQMRQGYRKMDMAAEEMPVKTPTPCT